MRSGTRREELLFSADDLKKIHMLRRALSGRKPAEAMEMLLDRLKLTPNNAAFLKSLGG
jgi:transcription termination factor Rho